jgi:nucleotide-binding universal stress UspA family protein
MRPIQRILLGLDLSPECADVWREACALARTFEAELVILHVTPCGAREEDVAGRLADMVKAGQAEGVRVSPQVLRREGDPGDALLACAEELPGVDLLVVGAGTRTRLDHVLLGSTAERVVRDAERPVWVVRPGRGHTRFARVLVALDPLRPKHEVARAAARVARAAGARLSALAVVTAPPEGGVEAVRARVLAALGAAEAQGVTPAEVIVREAAKAPPEIVDAVAREQADALVMGDSLVRGPARLREGNTVEKVLRLVPCSILRVR